MSCCPRYWMGTVRSPWPCCRSTLAASCWPASSLDHWGSRRRDRDQVSAVGQLRHSQPDASAAELYRSALTIGRDHISSAVKALVGSIELVASVPISTWLAARVHRLAHTDPAKTTIPREAKRPTGRVLVTVDAWLRNWRRSSLSIPCRRRGQRLRLQWSGNFRVRFRTFVPTVDDVALAHQPALQNGATSMTCIAPGHRATMPAEQCPAAASDPNGGCAVNPFPYVRAVC